MKNARFHYSPKLDMLILDTAEPLTPYQQSRCVSFALQVFIQ